MDNQSHLKNPVHVHMSPPAHTPVFEVQLRVAAASLLPARAACGLCAFVAGGERGVFSFSRRRVVILLACVVFFKTPMTPLCTAGSAIAIAGGYLYSLAKGREKTKAKEAAAGAEEPKSQ